VFELDVGGVRRHLFDQRTPDQVDQLRRISKSLLGFNWLGRRP